MQFNARYSQVQSTCQIEGPALQSLSHKVKKGERFMATLRKWTRMMLSSSVCMCRAVSAEGRGFGGSAPQVYKDDAGSSYEV